MRYKTIQERLKNPEVVLMDGAMGTEILNRGVRTTLPLWSADALFSSPQVVQQIHEDYIKAGAEIIITNTFSTTYRMFDKKSIGEKAKEAVLIACTVAQQARKATHTEGNVFIAGSVAPLEDCYSPALTPPEKALQREHFELVSNLKEGGIDFLLVETMITLRETLAVLEAAKKLDLPVAVSFCCNDNLQLLGGESLSAVVKEIEKYKPLFIGVNCVSANIATKTVKYLNTITPYPISAYAQGDGIPDDDQGWKFEKHDQQQLYIQQAEQWINSGAKIIGGCCGTTPEYIKELALLIVRNKK